MKGFLEVFPGLQMTEQMTELLGLVKVEKVSMNRDKSAIRIAIVSPRLIHKKNIIDLERGICDQLFPGKRIEIKIFEKYQLSGQYTPEKLLKAYRDSLLLELKHYSIVEYTMFRKAEFSFPQPDVMRMTIEDTMVNKEKAGELKRILEKVFHERCGLPVELLFDYVEPVRAKASIERERYARQEAQRMTAKVAPILGLHLAESEVAGMAETPWGNGGGQDIAGRNGEGGAGKENSGAGYGTADKVGAAGANNGLAGRSGIRAEGAGGANKTDTHAVVSEIKGGRPAVSGKETGFSGGRSEKRSGLKKGDWSNGGYRRKSDNPDVLFGRDFADDFTELDKLEGEIGEVILRGKILDKETRLLRSGKTIFIFHLTDFTDTITVKMFADENTLEDMENAVKAGSFIRLWGTTTIDRFDGELSIGSVRGIKKCEDFTAKRSDNSPVKRVELHCHTKMSDMDGVSEVKDMVKRAKAWGMPAIAVTDHGCVQAFPDASHALDKGDDFKILYGVEGYLVDDMKDLVENSQGQSFQDSYVVFDIETTGFSPEKNQIIEIGAVKVINGRITDSFSTFVNPDVPIPFEIENLTGISDNMVLTAPKIEKVLPQFLDFCDGCVLVAHNASFDVSFIAHQSGCQGLAFQPTVLDTVAMARHLLPNLNRFKLDTVAKALGISLENHHRAVDDAKATAEIFVKFVEMLRAQGIEDLDQLNRMSALNADMVKKLPTYHVIILAKNEVGRTNLYRLISWSHIDYFARRPRIPKSVLNQYREGLIIGSACEAGELFQAMLRGLPEPELMKIAGFYDYLEIQPLGNNAFMLRDEKSTV